MKAIKFVLCLLGAYVVFQLVGLTILYFSIKEANREAQRMHCREEIEASFEGGVYSIDQYEYNEYMNKKSFGISVNWVSPERPYVSLKFNRKKYPELLEILEEDQCIYKSSGDSTFTLILKNGEERQFLMPSCNW
ncbi:MAG: hypothetical protein AAFY36_15730 [Bacteroidota bacterium]